MGAILMALVAVVALVAVAVAVTVAVRATRSRDDLERLTEEARLAAMAHHEELVASRDAAVDRALEHAVAQLAETNRAQFEAQSAAQLSSGTAALEQRKTLIDRELATMKGELEKVGELMHSLERDREKKFGEIGQLLEAQSKGLSDLNATTESLGRTLSGPKSRGQWGERMAEDVLAHAGLLENVNFHKQRRIPSGEVPDFTFLLPNDLLLHMDVKFPFDNLRKASETDSEIEARKCRDAFRRDVRDRVKELAGRGYVDTSTTVDCVLLFIPSDELYAFIQQDDPDLVDEALKRRVVLCSPLTLFPVLAIVRQSVDNFRLERTSHEILQRLTGFQAQWEKFSGQVEKVGDRITAAGKAFDELNGVRRRGMEKELARIEELRTQVEPPDGESREGLTRPDSGPDEPPLALRA